MCIDIYRERETWSAVSVSPSGLSMRCVELAFFATLVPLRPMFISVLMKSFRESQFPHKYVNLSFIRTNIKNKLMDLCVN